VSSSSTGSALPDAGARLGVARALNASRLSEEEIARSAETSLSCAPPRLELLDFSEERRDEFGGVARPEARLRSEDTPREEGAFRSLESFRAEEDLKLSPKNPDECEPLVLLKLCPLRDGVGWGCVWMAMASSNFTSSIRYSFSVQHPCQQLRQSRIRNWKQNASILIAG
jgi:hypothetical protein